MARFILVAGVVLSLCAQAAGGDEETFHPEKAVLEQFPRRIPANGSITFKAGLKPGFYAPVLVLTRPDGSTGYLHPSRSPSRSDHEFDAAFESGEGTYRVELIVDSKRGDTTAAQFSIQVGAKRTETRASEAEARPESDYAAELEDESTIRLERKLFRRMNDYRKKNRLEPYPWLEHAAILAREHWTDYLALEPRPEKLTHLIPGDGSIADRFVDFFAWPETIRKFPIEHPNIGPRARSYCSESLAAPRSLDHLFNEVLLRESAFRAPIVSEYPSHSAVGIVRDGKGGRLYTAAVYVQVNSTRVLDDLAVALKTTTRLESKARESEERAELLRRLGRMGYESSVRLFRRRLTESDPAVRAAALDALFLNAPEIAEEWVGESVPRLVRAHRDGDYSKAIGILETFAAVEYDARTRIRGKSELAQLARLADQLLEFATALLAAGEVVEAHENLTHLVKRFPGFPAADAAADRIREIESDADLRAKLENR